MQRHRSCCCQAQTAHSQLVFQELILYIFQQVWAIAALPMLVLPLCWF
jgi:hypothetical protein